jgi:hypothetical protein
MEREMMDDSDIWSPLAPPEDTTPDHFPQLGSISPAFMFRFMVVPDTEPTAPEYVYVKPPARRSSLEVLGKFYSALVEWNSMWEAGGFTSEVFNPKHLPDSLKWLLEVRDRNLRLVTRRPKNRYDAYAPLYHLLPVDALRSAGLPLLRRGLWPHWPVNRTHEYIGEDFDLRLAEAFSRHIWPLLNGRTGRFAFTSDDPIRVLSHHLDFWLPYIDVVAQRRMKTNGRVPPERDDKTFERDRGDMNRLNAESGARADRPLRGGQLWVGEDDAWDVAQELVEVADEHGALRGIIDAVRSHRVRDDFSSVWSYEREDFERRLHRKRSKLKVVFVEMSDTVPVYAEDAEVHEHLLWGDFMALLDAKERRVAVCLRSGTHGAVDIAHQLGYANHSPVSKALAKIRRKAEAFFGLSQVGMSRVS